MVWKVVAIDDAGNLSARFEARLAALLTAARNRANHTGTQDIATVTGVTEAVQDILSSTLVAGSGVGLTYNDAGNTLTLTFTGGVGGATDPEVVRDTIGAALSAGTGISLTVDDVNDTITISSTVPTVNPNGPVPLFRQTGTTFTLALTHMGAVVERSNAAANTTTIPPNVFPVGAVVQITQYGTGQSSLVAGAGVTLRTASSLTTRAQYSVIGAYQTATNEWIVNGDLT